MCPTVTRDRLVKVVVDPKDQRSRIVMLTSAGKDRLKFATRNAQALRRTLDVASSERFAAAFEKEHSTGRIGV
jgi:DNA-binding MarR family transcriptional regulator